MRAALAPAAPKQSVCPMSVIACQDFIPALTSCMLACATMAFITSHWPCHCARVEAQRQGQCDMITAIFAQADMHFVRAGVKPRQAIANIAQANCFGAIAVGSTRTPRARREIVTDPHTQTCRFAGDLDF